MLFACIFQHNCATLCNIVQTIACFGTKKEGENRVKVLIFAERGGFEPPKRFRRLHAFQALRLYNLYNIVSDNYRRYIFYQHAICMQSTILTLLKRCFTNVVLSSFYTVPNASVLPPLEEEAAHLCRAAAN